MGKPPSIKTNFIINFIRVSINLLFPLVTFPYVFRILLADGVGKVTFAQSLTSYFVLLSGLGLSIYGIRAIAQVRDNKEEMSKTVLELLAIILFSTFLVFSLFMIFIHFGVNNDHQKNLLFLFSFTIFFTNIGVEWFYQGLEKYKYITIRDIIFKVISLILLFTFVNDKDDYVIYACILIFSVSGSAILNFINLRKFISIKISFKDLNLRRHFKPLLLAFGFSIATSIYINLDTVMLGYLTDEREVGLYTASIRIVKIVVVLVTTLGFVLIPRISYYIENGKHEEFRRIAKMSSNFTFLLGFPSMVGLFILAPEIILAFAGEDFFEATTAMRILVPIILVLSYSNFTGIQILYPHSKEKIVLISVLIGAVVNISLNFLLIPKYGYEGAAVATLIAETIVLIVQLLLGREILSFLKFDNNYVKIIFSSLMMTFVVFFVNQISLNLYVDLIMSIFLGGLIYFIFLLILKEEFISNVFKRRGF